MAFTTTNLYAIGDLQGCLDEARLLLEQLPADARVLFVGDLVNRGPASLATLRHVMALEQASDGRVDALLGNHDLHLLAVASGAQPRSRHDTLDELPAAPDCAALMDWLRRRPLARHEAGHLFVHAGVPPQWSVARTIELAREVENVLRGPDYRDFLADMYGNEPARWDDGLRGTARLRCIVNALTRLRFCTADGEMDFALKESAVAPPGSGLLPWFEIGTRASAGTPVVFGHWSALGLLLRPDAIGIDSGCVWGGQLTAVALPERRLVQVPCPEYQAIRSKSA
ncbi:symmetrical bis(5'-nucleosyl)-tetraphosphatase [Massilia sp. TS11]|uniref:symmetrical bis(5'-nucleosyl)-tetraphosphatase n=1 Tax=Massilia sp. TS11 TaxID=2908003 RepID=UPI001EDA26D7|nr:symmetrical bis(5'-nucleosyl)-tetraphosphatase [Massilia sp. TS11]MCG2583468.1 symmetrical bis(5'-nucleosyl)-tetraphosphatase [Massilia sp. TS11]